MLNTELREVSDERRLDCGLLDLFKQAEEASGLKPIDLDYIKFRIGKTDDFPIEFIISNFNMYDRMTVIVDSKFKRYVNHIELGSRVKTYCDTLSRLLAENYGSNYTVEKFIQDDEYLDGTYTDICARIKYTA